MALTGVIPSNNVHEIVRLVHLKTSCDYYFHAHIEKSVSDFYCQGVLTMKKLLSCRFNIDTASVEIRHTDSSQISIYTLGVDDEICPTVPMQTEIDWLIYNEPATYANLVFSGELEQYARNMAGTHGLED